MEQNNYHVQENQVSEPIGEPTPENEVTTNEPTLENDVTITEQKRKKKPIKLLIIGGVVIVALIAAIILCPLLIKESKYKKAFELIDDQEYQAAYDIFKELGDYKDSEDHLGKFRYVLVEGFEIDEKTKEKTTYEEYFLNENGLPEKMVLHIYGDKEVIRNCTYNEEGRLVKDVYTYEGKCITTIDFGYDKNGNLTKQISTDSEGRQTSLTYDYDQNGNLIKETDIRYPDYGTSIGPGGAVISSDWNETIEYSYDKYGNVIKETITSAQGKVSTIEYSYNLLGKVTEMIETDSHGNVSTTIYRYDQKGNLEIEVNETRDHQTITEYTYDEKNNLIKTATKLPGGNIYATEYTYDERNNLVKTILIDYEGSQEIHRECYEYTYDENNNQIKVVTTDQNGYSDEYENRYELVYFPFDITDGEYYRMLQFDPMVLYYMWGMLSYVPGSIN